LPWRNSTFAPINVVYPSPKIRQTQTRAFQESAAPSRRGWCARRAEQRFAWPSAGGAAVGTSRRSASSASSSVRRRALFQTHTSARQKRRHPLKTSPPPTGRTGSQCRACLLLQRYDPERFRERSLWTHTAGDGEVSDLHCLYDGNPRTGRKLRRLQYGRHGTAVRQKPERPARHDGLFNLFRALVHGTGR